MGLKQEVRELLQQGREEALAELAASRPAAVRPLVGRLWDRDTLIRRRAASALGRTAATNPEVGLEIIRRLMWGLNDESATNGVYGLPALGEIGRHAPELFSPFVPALAAMAWDDGLRLELLRALEAVAESSPDSVRPHLEALADRIDSGRPDEVAAYRRLADAAGEGENDEE